ncbi:unnamed protein product [Musa banksii]
MLVATMHFRAPSSAFWKIFACLQISWQLRIDRQYQELWDCFACGCDELFHTLSKSIAGSFNLILPCHKDENVTRSACNVNSHRLLNSSFNIVFTRCFAVQDIYMECPSRDLKSRNTGT